MRGKCPKDKRGTKIENKLKIKLKIIVFTIHKHPIASKAGTSPQGGEGLGNNNREIETKNKNEIEINDENEIEIKTNNEITNSFVEKLNEGRNKDKETEVGM